MTNNLCKIPYEVYVSEPHWCCKSLFFSLLFSFAYQQNAEMAFNFGASPFKHPPENSFIPLTQAPKECVQCPETAPVKVVKDAPQAIIIEVLRMSYSTILKAVYLNDDALLVVNFCTCFHSLPKSWLIRHSARLICS